MLSSGGLVSTNLEQIIKEVMMTSWRGNWFGLAFRYREATERVSCSVEMLSLSWSHTINKYSTISGGRAIGFKEYLDALIKSRSQEGYFNRAFYCSRVEANDNRVLSIFGS